ncbi:hypothetical protein H5410_036363 [Solanum commersonii]|uniref:Uncharacterized protein n=1 Tax=Solanum commersonii TaxID=4109 RepID=A0A9J5Y3C4_SOLCO|nr:hypothetical protein H5410_036363 [Solanum commersonii]
MENLASHPYNARSKGKKKMAYKDGNESDSDEVPPFSICDYLNINMSPPIQVSTNDPIYPPSFGPYANTSKVAGTSTVRPLITTMMNLRSKGFNHVAQCAYHSDALGHSTEYCRTLKSEVEKMIQAKMIVIQNDNPPNVTQNPLPTSNDVHFSEMIGDENSLKSEEKTIEIGGAFRKANVQSSG